MEEIGTNLNTCAVDKHKLEIERYTYTHSEGKL